MGRAKVDIVLIVPGQGRWIYTRVLNCLEYYPFGAQRVHYRDEFSDKKNTRQHALQRALKLELKRQKGELEMEETN